MKPDYAKATAELLDRLRRTAGAIHAPQTPARPSLPGTGNVIINAPRDCVFYITPQQPAPPSDAT